MYISMILFYISLAGIIGMMWHKSFELRNNKRSWFSLFAERFDHRVHAAYASVRTFLSYFNRKTAVALVEWMAVHILSWLRSAYIWMHRKAHAHPPSKKVIDMVRGRGEVESKSGASFYFKRLGEESN